MCESEYPFGKISGEAAEVELSFRVRYSRQFRQVLQIAASPVAAVKAFGIHPDGTTWLRERAALRHAAFHLQAFGRCQRQIP